MDAMKAIVYREGTPQPQLPFQGNPRDENSKTGG
jgi:hypothetical protein